MAVSVGCDLVALIRGRGIERTGGFEVNPEGCAGSYGVPAWFILLVKSMWP
jgi:hypothetical protein